MSDFDCSCTDEIVCPYCGHEHTDSWDMVSNKSHSDVQCGECELWFRVYPESSTVYTSAKLDNKDEATDAS